MTDKEFKRLSRAQLIEIIYQLQLQLDSLTEQNKTLEAALADKRLRIDQAGNLAEAALEINDFFRSAQNAAEQYLYEIQQIREETIKTREQTLADARAEAERILADAKTTRGDADAVIETILREFGSASTDGR